MKYFYLLLCNLFNNFDQITTVLTVLIVRAFDFKIYQQFRQFSFYVRRERRYQLTLRFECDKNRTVPGSFIWRFRRIE